MQDAQTPQQALDIAAAATRQAHEAAAVPSWGPSVAGLLTALTVMLLDTAVEEDLSTVLTAILIIAAIATSFALLKVAFWMRATRRARGIIPRPPSQWKDEAVSWLAIVIVPCLALVHSGLGVWLRLLASVILGGWVWYSQSRPQTAPWKTRPRTAPWKN
ncbi:hypothetical protein ACLMAL_14115 [Nocardia sp. CWNU-33]|uniref:hypothetical protein n=1 Tax=Nocardia sp. CWNU-33 TaxID=3392117 RepID=UPI00398F6422